MSPDERTTIVFELLSKERQQAVIIHREQEAIAAAKVAARSAYSSLEEGIQMSLDQVFQDIKGAREQRENEIAVLDRRESYLGERLLVVGSQAELPLRPKA